MKSIWDISISSILVLGMGGCGLILDVDAGEYSPECQAGELECEGNTPRNCVNGLWEALPTCTGQTCLGGQCRGSCEAGKKICDGNTPTGCDSNGNPVPGTACSGVTSLCFEGECVTPSCAGLPNTCGPKGDESCCALTSVPGGTYNRSNDPMYPATVSDFVLDRFEVTVGRFRKFVEGYPGNKPKPGDGKHPLIAGSGWDAAWDSSLPADKAGLIAKVKCDANLQMWMDAPGANENKPMNCLTWYESFAFCAWDGGRLPTEAEWEYAAVGGNQQRMYPWSNPPDSMLVDESYAVCLCLGDGSAANECTFADILMVGSKSPKGDGRWGQADLSGSMWEWTLDWYADPYVDVICENCANLVGGPERVNRGASWSSNGWYLPTHRNHADPAIRHGDANPRCARSL